jgi:hypothetical protein
MKGGSVRNCGGSLWRFWEFYMFQILTDKKSATLIDNIIYAVFPLIK